MSDAKKRQKMIQSEHQATLVSENNGIGHRVMASIDHWMVNLVLLFRRATGA